MSTRATGPSLRVLLVVLLVTPAGRSFGNFDDSRTPGSFGHSAGLGAATSFGNFGDTRAEAKTAGLPSSFRTFVGVARMPPSVGATSFGNFGATPFFQWSWTPDPSSKRPNGGAEFVSHFSVARGVTGIILRKLLDSS